MAIKIEPYAAHHEPLVRDFNQRLTAGGSPLQFPLNSIDGGLPKGGDAELYREMFVAVDGDGAVRGGYFLKRQPFIVAGQRRSIANYAFPLSEGVIDRRFGLLGVSMLLDAQRREPFLYGLGMGGESHPSVRIMKGVGWSATAVPFFFRVIRPYRFLRNIEFLRRDPAKRLAVDAAAFTGAGWAAVRLAGLLRRNRPTRGFSYEQVGDFGDWVDDVWEKATGAESFVGVRNRRTLALLYPQGNSRYIKLRVDGPGGAAGWAVCLSTQMRGSGYFGDMRVGSIADGMATPGNVLQVIAAADRELVRRGVDVIVSNQAHLSWCEALRSTGYLPGPSNYILTCSKALVAALGPLDRIRERCHVNRGDGDGPINL